MERSLKIKGTQEKETKLPRFCITKFQYDTLKLWFTTLVETSQKTNVLISCENWKSVEYRLVVADRKTATC